MFVTYLTRNTTFSLSFFSRHKHSFCNFYIMYKLQKFTYKLYFHVIFSSERWLYTFKNISHFPLFLSWKKNEKFMYFSCSLEFSRVVSFHNAYSSESSHNSQQKQDSEMVKNIKKLFHRIFSIFSVHFPSSFFSLNKKL